MGHKKPPVLSTAMLLRIRRNHNPATRYPIHAPIADVNAPGTRLEKRMRMTEPQDRLAREREEIAIRVANFKATQQKFQRAREEYFVTTLENAKHSEHSRPTLESAPF
jgi:hypothetical protein